MSPSDAPASAHPPTSVKTDGSPMLRVAVTPSSDTAVQLKRVRCSVVVFWCMHLQHSQRNRPTNQLRHLNGIFFHVLKCHENMNFPPLEIGRKRYMQVEQGSFLTSVLLPQGPKQQQQPNPSKNTSSLGYLSGYIHPPSWDGWILNPGLQNILDNILKQENICGTHIDVQERFTHRMISPAHGPPKLTQSDTHRTVSPLMAQRSAHTSNIKPTLSNAQERFTHRMISPAHGPKISSHEATSKGH